jgi:hypothetical protein
MDKDKLQVRKRSRKPVDRAISYQAIFSSKDGEKVLYDLMKEHHMIGSTFTKDPHEMSFREGERNVVLRIMHILKIDVDALAKRIEEGLKQEESYN